MIAELRGELKATRSMLDNRVTVSEGTHRTVVDERAVIRKVHG